MTSIGEKCRTTEQSHSGRHQDDASDVDIRSPGRICQKHLLSELTKYGTVDGRALRHNLPQCTESPPAQCAGHPFAVMITCTEFCHLADTEISYSAFLDQAHIQFRFVVLSTIMIVSRNYYLTTHVPNADGTQPNNESQCAPIHHDDMTVYHATVCAFSIQPLSGIRRLCLIKHHQQNIPSV